MKMIDVRELYPATDVMKSVLNDIDGIEKRIEEYCLVVTSINDMRPTTVVLHEEIEDRVLLPSRYIVVHTYELAEKIHYILNKIINEVKPLENECAKALSSNVAIRANAEATEYKSRELAEMMHVLPVISVADLNRWHDDQLGSIQLSNLHQLGAEISLIKQKLDRLIKGLELPDGYIPPLNKDKLY